MTSLIRDTFDFAADAVAETMGEDVSYIRTSVVGDDPAVTVRAVFGSGFQAVQSGEIRVSSRRPEIEIRKDALEDADGDTFDAEQGHRVTVRGQEYEVATVRPDAEDVTWMLTLKEWDWTR